MEFQKIPKCINTEFTYTNHVCILKAKHTNEYTHSKQKYMYGV